MKTIGLTFLDPWTGVAAGVLGGLWLILLYFLKLRRRPVRVTSTLLWFNSTADLQVNVPFRWLRLSWLLLLQLAGLGCLAAALARPAISAQGAGASPVILLIDRSASMAAADVAPGSADSPSRLDAARVKAAEILDLLPRDAPAIVASFSLDAVGHTNLTRDRALLRNAVRSLGQTDQPGNLEAGFELVRALAAQTSESDEGAAPRAILISDGAYAAASTKGVGRARLEYIRIGPPAAAPAAIDNVGIVALAARRDYEDPATVRLFVRVQSVVARPLDVPLACRLGDSPDLFAAATLALAAGSAESPADASRTFEFQNTEGGLVTVSIERPDSLPADDEAGVVLSPAAALRVVLVRPNLAMDALDEIVKAALEALGPASLRVMNAGEYESASKGALEADLIVFDRVRPARLPAAPSLSFGATLPIPGVGAPTDGEGGPARPTGFAYWIRSHPVMRYVTLDDVWVNEPMRLSLPTEGVPGPGSVPIRIEPLASGAGGPLIVLIAQGGTRRIIVGFDLGQSNWVKDAGFHIFLKNATDYLTLSGEDEAGAAVRTTEPAVVRPAPGATRIDVSGPTTLVRDVRREEGDRVVIGPLPRVGRHAISGVVEADAALFVSLLDPFESRIAVRDAVESAGGRTEAVAASQIAPREIWPWFVLAAIALLTVEWFVFALRMRV